MNPKKITDSSEFPVIRSQVGDLRIISAVPRKPARGWHDKAEIQKLARLLIRCCVDDIQHAQWQRDV